MEQDVRPASSDIGRKSGSSIYVDKKVVRSYARLELTFAEVAALIRYQPHVLDRDVLDIGVGTGRTAKWLAPLARKYQGIDYSPAMVARCKSRYPKLSVALADMRDLSSFDDASFDFVLGSANVISVVSHTDRLVVLREIWRVLRATGVFMFSSHNRNYRLAGAEPRLSYVGGLRGPVRSVNNYLESIRNYRRLRRQWTENSEYMICSDLGHNFGLLHYYLTRTKQETQLDATGFSVIDVFDSAGNRLAVGEDDSNSPHLLYVARKRT
jgi:SAM-dependent methyltransferase